MTDATARCIVFDFGNVIAFFDHMIACRRLASLSPLGLDPQNVYERVFNSTLEADYDCGRLSTPTFVSRLKQDLHLEASTETIATAWCDIFSPNPVMEAVVFQHRRRGTRLVLASNTNELHYRWFSRVFEPVLQLFDEHVLSFTLGARKPAAQFFEACIEAAGRPAKHIVYVDDRPDYATEARRLGMEAYVYDPALPLPPALLL